MNSKTHGAFSLRALTQRTTNVKVPHNQASLGQVLYPEPKHAAVTPEIS